MLPTDVLMSEHRVIEQVLDVLDRVASRAVASGKLDGAAAVEIVDFLRNFADRCHHGKEEHQLFPALEENGMPPDGGPTGVMRDEHAQSRELIALMEEAIPAASQREQKALQEYGSAAGAYSELLRAHIHKEDHCLFPMVKNYLSAEAQTELMDAFHTVETEDIGHGVHEHYLELAIRLAQRYGLEAAFAPEDIPRMACGCNHGH